MLALERKTADKSLLGIYYVPVVLLRTICVFTIPLKGGIAPQEVTIILPILQVRNVEVQRAEVTHPKSWARSGRAWVSLGLIPGRVLDLYPIFSQLVKFNPFVLQMRAKA